jgi:hypothetical protein
MKTCHAEREGTDVDMGDDWRDWSRSWLRPDSFAHPQSSSGGGGPGHFVVPGPIGLDRTPHVLPFADPGSFVTPVPHPQSPAARHFDWHRLPLIDQAERVYAVFKAILRSYRYIPEALLQATGEELYSILRGIIPGLVISLGIMAITTLGGAAAGAALGALAGGVGAGPGAVAGAAAGAEVGLFILEWLGVAFLAAYVLASMVAAAKKFYEGDTVAWRSVDAGPSADLEVERAAKILAGAVAEIFRGILQGIVAFLISKGIGAAKARVPELVGKLRSSRLGRGFAEWVETNWERLINNKKLRPGGEASPPAPGPSGGGGGAAPGGGGPPPGPAPPPKPAPRPKPAPPPEAAKPTPGAEDARLNELAKDPAQGGKVTPKTMQEARVANDLEKSGKVPGPVKRDPTGGADFIDGEGQDWDVKGFNSNFPPEKGGYSLSDSMTKIGKAVDSGENVMLDTSNMSPQAAQELKGAVDANPAWSGKVLWWP